MKNLNVNDDAPNFLLFADNGETVCLNDFRGKIVVLYFYPKDDTPGCTQEAKDFSEKHDYFKKKNVVVFGVSRDNIETHDNFKRKYKIPFQLIADEDTKACNEYGVWVEKSMYGKKYMGIERATFLIGRAGKIKKIWRKVKVVGHVEEVVKAADEEINASFDE